MSEKNRKKTTPKTEKKLFTKGGQPGPGRGNKKPSKPLTYEDIESLLQPDLKDKDPKVRHTATRLLLTLKGKMPGSEDSQILDPIFMPLHNLLWRVAEGHLEKTGQPISGIEALDIVKTHFETCSHTPIKSIGWEEVEGMEGDDL